MRNYWYIPAAVLFVLVIVGFFAGWLQLSLGPDVWGVVFTTSRGFEKIAVSPAAFTWRARRLIPRAITLYRVPLSPEKVNLDIHAMLPSAEAYASLASDRPDFSIELKISGLYRIRSDALPSLVEKGGLRPENLLDWHAEQRAEMERQATELALSLDTAPDPATFGARLASALQERFPSLEFLSLSPTLVRMPDPRLYARLRAAYLHGIDAKEGALIALAPKIAAEEASQRIALQRQEASIAVLAKYGELLKRYPPLLKFLFIAISQKMSAKDLQTLDLLDRLPTLE
jgi:hypothetical protein